MDIFYEKGPEVEVSFSTTSAIHHLLIFLAFGQSCSQQGRLFRLLEHNPELTVADTVRLRDTVVSQMVKSDTFVFLSRVLKFDKILTKL